MVTTLIVKATVVSSGGRAQSSSRVVLSPECHRRGARKSKTGDCGSAGTELAGLFHPRPIAR